MEMLYYQKKNAILNREEAGLEWLLKELLTDLNVDSEYFIRNVKVTRKQ